MNKTEVTPRTGEDLSPVQQVKSAVEGFAQDFRAFQNDITHRMEKQEQRMSKFDSKTTLGRPALSAAADEIAPHRKAFDAYLRSGDDDGLRHREIGRAHV